MTTPHQPQPHTDGWQPIMAPEHYRLVLHNVRVLAPQKLRRKPNWSLAMQMFATGSTYAWKACEYAEIDPDAYTVGEVWRRPSTTQSHDGETE